MGDMLIKNKSEGEDVKLVKLLCIAILCLSGLFITSNSWAYDNCEYFHEALKDVDNNSGTGGPVTVVQEGETPHDTQGIEYIVTAYVFEDRDPKEKD